MTFIDALFQFKDCTIKTIVVADVPKSLEDFNSRIVRLRPQMAGDKLKGIIISIQGLYD